MQVIRFDQAGTFVPRGHDGVLNRALAGQEATGTGELSVWHGSFDADGAAGVHVHDTSAQVYVVLSGSFEIGDGERTHRLGVHDTAVIPAGERHSIAAADGPGTVLVISSPALR
jgi:mannose-6-phosphate isomerase-like protein (cupin superfamily)